MAKQQSSIDQADDVCVVQVLGDVLQHYSDLLTPYSDEDYRFAQGCKNVLIRSICEGAIDFMRSSESFDSVIESMSSHPPALGKTYSPTADSFQVLVDRLKRIAASTNRLRVIARRYPAGVRSPRVEVYLFGVHIPGGSESRPTVQIKALLPVVLQMSDAVPIVHPTNTLPKSAKPSENSVHGTKGSSTPTTKPGRSKNR